MNTRKTDTKVRGYCSFLVGVVAVILVSPSASAQEWRLQPEVRVGGEYDDNARLATSGSTVQEIDGYLIGAALGIGYATERTTFNLKPRIVTRMYDETPDVDADDQFVDFDFMRASLKSELGVRASYSRESVRTAERADPELDADDPNEIPTDETGLVFTNEQRERFRIAPQWTYDVTERTAIGARASYTDVSYDDATTNFLVDYSDWRVEGLLSRRLSERTRGYVGLSARQFDNKSNNEDFDGVGIGIGIETEVSQKTSFQGEIGYEDTEQTSTGESDANLVANLNIVRRLETVTMLAQYRRNVSSGGSGRVTARDSLNLNIRKDFSERVTGGLGVRAYHSDKVGNETTALNTKDFLQFRAQLSVALSRAFSLEANYRYANVDRSGSDGNADSNSVTLWLVYRPTAIVN